MREGGGGGECMLFGPSAQTYVRGGGGIDTVGAKHIKVSRKETGLF